jgi:hypothetical protein
MLTTLDYVILTRAQFLYAPPNALYGCLTLTTESHRIVYPWDVLLRYKRRKRGQVVDLSFSSICVCLMRSSGRVPVKNETY